MEFTEQKELLEGYLKWKGEVKLNDNSPEAYLKWCTRESAFEKLVKIDDAITLVLKNPEIYPSEDVALSIREIINDGV